MDKDLERKRYLEVTWTKICGGRRGTWKGHVKDLERQRDMEETWTKI